MPNVEDLKDAQDALVAAALDLTLLVSPYLTTMPSVMAEADGDLAAVPDPWDTVGEVQKAAGMSLTPELTTKDIEGYGSSGARRTLITKEAFTIDATLQETLRRLNNELYYRTKMGATVPDPSSGEVRTIKPNNAGVHYYSAILIASDGALGEEIYPYWQFPRISVTKSGALPLKTDAEMLMPVTLSIYNERRRADWATPGPFAFGIAGKGWKSLVDAGKTGYTTAVNEVQLVTVTGATGGTFTLSFGAQTTAAIAYNATAATLRAALEALSTVGAGNVEVTGSAGGPWTVTFKGTLAGSNVAEMTASGTSLTGTSPAVTVSTVTSGQP